MQVKRNALAGSGSSAEPRIVAALTTTAARAACCFVVRNVPLTTADGAHSAALHVIRSVEPYDIPTVAWIAAVTATLSAVGVNVRHPPQERVRVSFKDATAAPSAKRGATSPRKETDLPVNRTEFLKTGLGTAAGLGLAGAGWDWARAAETPIGNYPAGTEGSSVFVGLLCDLTGSYSADGEDLRKGYLLALDDLNNGTGVMAKIASLAGKKGLLGKKVEYKVADTETKPDPAVQHATEFITQNKAIMFCGGVSSAEVIAMAKLGQQQKVIYMTGASGSNDTTGKDCQRYCFRSQLDAYMVAASLGPHLVKAYGKNRKAIYLTPDYSYGHSLANSMKAETEKLGWKTVADVVAPFPTSDYSSYLTNIANSDADVFINIEFGNDGIASTKQAAQFGIMKKMQLVIPNISTYLPDGLGPEIMQGVYGTQDWYWRLQDRYPLSKIFVQDFVGRWKIRPRWTAHIAYAQTAIWADAVTRAGTFNPVNVIKTLEEGKPTNLMLGPVHYRAGDHQQVRPCPVLLGKKPSAMEGKDDFFDVVDVVPGERVMQPLEDTSCKLPAYS